MTSRRELFYAIAGMPVMVAFGEQVTKAKGDLDVRRLYTQADAYIKAQPLPSTQAGFSEVKAAMQSDDDYAWSWHCNVACAAMDEGVDHKTAQKIAARFMGWAFQVDTERLVQGRTELNKVVNNDESRKAQIRMS